MRVYVVRHGQSETNLQERYTGWFDTPLTEKGIEDAKKAGELLKCRSYDLVFSSDLIRAVRTAQTALPGYEMKRSPLLREINVGGLEQIPFTDLSEEQRAEAGRTGYSAFGGESKAEFYGRVSSFMKELESLDCETVAVFTHAGWLRSMLDTVVGYVIPRRNLRCNNCAVAEFEYINGIWSLCSWNNPVDR